MNRLFFAKRLSMFVLRIVSCYVILAGCRETPVAMKDTQKYSYSSEPLIYANKKAVKLEDEQIKEYVKRMGWQMKSTGTGLRYLIYQKGKGEFAVNGKMAKIEYECRLISGELCYSSAKSGTKEFKIGSGGVESGLEEGILLMQKGDKAKFILPSHLAFGIIGDQDKIPGKSTLVYDVHLLELN
jgi:FKBP-type peptidyl-prolyl cis-trans isomerase FkpA